jgi:hypothetical protein
MKKFSKKVKISIASTIVLIMLVGAAFATDEAFNVTMDLLTTIVITETQALSFPSQNEQSAATYTVLPADGTAATFTIAGEPSTAVTISVVEASINITDGTDNILIDNWAFDDNNPTLTAGGAGSVRVGADATTDITDDAASYTGTATLRIVY